MAEQSPSPILTVAVPVYDLESCIARCLRSLCDPSGPLGLGDVEVLVVDDGSTDASASVAEGFADAHPGLRVLRKANGGQGSVLELARRTARGTYFTVIDGDDEAVPDALRRVVGTLRWLEARGEAPDLLITDRLFHYDQNGRRRREGFRNALPAGRTFAWNEAGRLRSFQSFALNSLVFRRALLDTHGATLPERTHFTDVLYNHVPLPEAKRLFYLPVPMSVYHKGRPGQSTSPDSVLAHAEDHVRVTKLFAAACDRLPADAPPALASYLRGFFSHMLAASLGILAMTRHSTHDRRRADLIRWMRRNHPALLRRVALRPLVLGARFPGTVGSVLIGVAYRVKLLLHLID